MRTRLLRPSFWTDSKMAALSHGTRLTYTGLWSLADDAGFFEWDVRQIAGELYRFAPVKRRERDITKHLADLLDAERIKHLECGRHGVIPTLPDHRIKGGEQLFTVQKQHLRRCTTPDSVGLHRTTSDSVSDSLSDSVTSSDSGPTRRLKDIVPFDRRTGTYGLSEKVQ